MTPSFHPTIQALLMLNELHRFGFEQLRFHSYGGHGYGFIFAAHDEAPVSLKDTRFIPAVRSFTTLGVAEDAPAHEQHLAIKWRRLLQDGSRPHHLAGLFVLDFSDIARHGFGADETYRTWFRGLVPSLQQGLLPVTHSNFSHAEPLPVLTWGAPYGTHEEPFYPGPPLNPYLAEEV